MFACLQGIAGQRCVVRLFLTKDELIDVSQSNGHYSTCVVECKDLCKYLNCSIIYEVT